LIIYYIPTLLVENVGQDPQTAQILGGCVQIMFVLGCLAPALALDRMGRKKTMIFGCLGLGTCMTAAAALLIPGREATSSAAVAFFFLCEYHVYAPHERGAAPFVLFVASLAGGRHSPLFSSSR
jgi:MFS family permease